MNKDDNELVLFQEDLIENPTPRLPVCLVLDTSGSMSGKPIKELQDGVNYFFQELENDEVAKYSAEVAIITFGGKVKVPVDFGPVEDQNVSILKASGHTPMGKAVEKALQLLDDRKETYKNAGVDYYQPWLVIMTDGEPTDNIKTACNLVNQLTEAKKLSVFAIGVENANMEQLGKLSGGRKPLKLKGLEFKNFFLWLSSSVSRVSQSVPGEKVDLDPRLDWASI